MTTKYDYSRPLAIEEAEDLETALWFTIVNYTHHQLGIGLEDCKLRLKIEFERRIPSAAFDQLEKNYGWNLKGARLLDVGSGQGGAVLEALDRGSEARGIEPGEEFHKIAQMRVEEAGYDSSLIKRTGGEQLPFADNYCDYVTSLQVMEHVKDPRPIMEEMFRVLKPGGECYISCENYLSFSEQHYRVPWLPLLPKSIGCRYLKMIGRDPGFLQKYIYYTTYPQIWKISRRIGFKNRTYDALIDAFFNGGVPAKSSSRIIVNVLKYLPKKFRRNMTKWLLHMRYFFAVGVRVVLRKPG